jgi:hypothetical protein
MDPHKRWSCEQLLEHSYFDNYLIETKREDNKSKSYQAQNMFQNDRKSKQPGVSLKLFIYFLNDYCHLSTLLYTLLYNIKSLIVSEFIECSGFK